MCFPVGRQHLDIPLPLSVQISCDVLRCTTKDPSLQSQRCIVLSLWERGRVVRVEEK